MDLRTTTQTVPTRIAAMCFQIGRPHVSRNRQEDSLLFVSGESLARLKCSAFCRAFECALKMRTTEATQRGHMVDVHSGDVFGRSGQ
mmetsp:Transcript_8692/g.24268  ORF Transcript_8692/g.24268 Transcript_8692/m.24268 type:complete len:87 (+) Transcript_8692:552-812(+)